MSKMEEEVEPPQIIAQPMSVTVGTGQTLMLSVTASGGGLSYQWSRNGALLEGMTQSTYSKSGVSSADAANYTVTVSNILGSTTSNAATVTVTAPASSGGGGGGGGGSTSAWFIAALVALAAIRYLRPSRV